MASNATTARPGRAAQVIHFLFPSRRQVAISLASDIGLAVLGLPLWMHLALGVVLHSAIHLVGRLCRD
jgi:hypothetical protein